MPKIKCECGCIVNMSEIPNRHEWLLISDTNFDEYPDTMDKYQLYKEMKSLLICNNCERIIVFWNGFENSPVFYKKETIL